MENAAPPDNETSAASELDNIALFDTLKGWWKADARHSSKWRVEAKEDFDFVAGEQWSAEDKQVLNAKNRPHIVFNRILTILKAVAGMEINGRHEINYLPSNNENTAVNEVLSGASKWMADGCDGEDEESQAFQNCCICGMGWCENRLDYEDNPQGQYIEESVDPIEMYWDRTAKKKNLTDSRRMHRVRRMPIADAKQLFPGKDKSQLDAVWALGTEMDEATKTIEEKRRREENTTDTRDDDTHEVTIVNTQWWEREVYWLVADEQNNTKSELSDAEYKVLEERSELIGMPVNGVRMTRKIFKEAYLGGELLSSGPAPITGKFKYKFKWVAITGELHRTKGKWFGLARVVRDPQMWANKWLSQGLHILNTTAKGGIVAETDAFEDQRQAEETWAKADEITWVKRGALSGGPGSNKIMPKPGGTFPQGYFDVMQFAISAVRDVSGINLELLGLKDVNQPGVLEAHRKQAGMTVLATLFDSLRRFRKITGRIRLYFIQNHLSDGRLIRIVGKDGAKSVPLVHDQCVGEYDVIVDDTPTSPNQKETNWAIISSMLPMFKEQLAARPDLLASILEYSPLPSKLVDTVKDLINESMPKLDQQQEMAGKLAIAGKVAVINKDQSTAEMQNAKAGAVQATAVYDLAMSERMLTHSESDRSLTDAKAQGEHADAAHTKVKALMDAMAPQQPQGQQPQPQPPGPPMPPPQAPPMQAPPMHGARRARDGHWYLPDPNRHGKYLMIVPQAASMGMGGGNGAAPAG